MNTVGNVAQERRWAWFAAGLLLVLTLVFMGRTLVPPADQMLIGHDLRGLFYPWLTVAREALRAGRLPLWDPNQFSGQPFMSNPQVGLFYPPAWLTVLLPVNVGVSWYVALHIWLSGYGMVLFVRRISKSWAGALLAGLTFAFSGFMVARIEGGHIGLLATHAWIPWILMAYAWSIQRRDIWSAVIAGIPFGLAILAGHTTSLLYVGLIWGAFVVYLGLAERQWLLIIRQFAISGIAGVILSAVQLIPLLEFTMFSTRASGPLEEFGRWSMPPFHLIALFIPTYFGEPVHIGWWSVEGFEELTYYVGALPLLAIPLALRKPTRLSWLYVIMMVIGLLIAMGTYGFLYQVVCLLIPPFRMARVPARAAFLFVFGACALLGEVIATWERIAPDERKAILKSVMTWMILIIIIVGAIGLAATGAAFMVFHPSDTGGRLWHQANGWVWALVVFLGGGILLWRYFTSGTDTRRHRVLLASLAVLVVADLWFFGLKLLQLQPGVPSLFWLKAKEIIGDTPQRVVPWAVGLNIQDDASLVGLNSVLGYNTLEVAVHHDLGVGVGDPRSTAYDILGVEYILSQSALESTFTEGDHPLTLFTSNDIVWIYRRSRVLPIARLVYQTETIADPAQARARINEPDFDPTTTAILGVEPACQADLAFDTSGTAEIIERSPGYWKIDTESATPGLLVLSETAYPGWQVTIDGKQAESLIAYTAIRAVCVPAGKHQIEWVFDPITYKIGAGVTVLALVLCGWAGLRIRRINAINFADRAKEDN